MSAAEAIKEFVEPLLTGWQVQFGRWHDTGTRGDRFCVIRPVGGAPAELVRRPQFTLSLIGAVDAAASVASDAADELIEAMRESSGSLVFMQPSEPAYMPTNDGRAVFEFAVAAITT
jgi:hypothetical protein